MPIRADYERDGYAIVRNVIDHGLIEQAKAHVEWLIENHPELRPEELDTLFDVSVGYSLDGIRSDRVARWLDGLRDAAPILERLRASIDPDLRPFAPVQVPPQVYDCITLSTFHGCQPDEIEKIVEHLYARRSFQQTSDPALAAAGA